MILAYGNEIYTAVSQPVGSNSDLSDLKSQLRDAQNKTKVPVIAGKHIGVNVRVFCVDLRFTKEKQDFQALFVNPEIISSRAPLVSGLESDVAIPKLTLSIDRPKVVEVSFLDDVNTESTQSFSDLAARWIMNGIDHLEGITIIDRVNKHRQRSVRGQLKRIAEGRVETSYEMIYTSLKEKSDLVKKQNQ